jgi:hypothetical protein
MSSGPPERRAGGKALSETAEDEYRLGGPSPAMKLPPIPLDAAAEADP